MRGSRHHLQQSALVGQSSIRLSVDLSNRRRQPHTIRTETTHCVGLALSAERVKKPPLGVRRCRSSARNNQPCRTAPNTRYFSITTRWLRKNSFPCFRGHVRRVECQGWKTPTSRCSRRWSWCRIGSRFGQEKREHRLWRLVNFLTRQLSCIGAGYLDNCHFTLQLVHYLNIPLQKDLMLFDSTWHCWQSCTDRST